MVRFSFQYAQMLVVDELNVYIANIPSLISFGWKCVSPKDAFAKTSLIACYCYRGVRYIQPTLLVLFV